MELLLIPAAVEGGGGGGLYSSVGACGGRPSVTVGGCQHRLMHPSKQHRAPEIDFRDFLV